MRQSLNNFMVLGGVLLCAASVHAQATYIGASGGDFLEDSNWDTGVYPTNETYAVLNSTADIAGTAPNNTRALRLGVSSGDTGVLNVNSGASVSFTSQSNWDSHIGASGSGTVNVYAGGFINLNFVEIGRNSGSEGTVNLYGGTFQIARGSKEGNDNWSIHLGANDNNTAAGTGTINIYGGTLWTRGGVELGNQNSVTDGTASFNVYGSGATIGIGSNGDIDGNWFQGSNQTLKVGIDAGGVSTIWIEDYGDDGGVDVTFAAGSLLDVDFYNGMTNGGTWTVMEVEGTNIVDNGLVFADSVDTNIWSFAIDNSGDNGLLTVTAQGEPVQVITNQLVGLWKFDEGSGTTAYNSAATGSAYDGTIVNPNFTDGIDAGTGALEFGDSLGSYVAIPDAAFDLIENGITIAMWTYGSDILGNGSDEANNSAFGSYNRKLQSHLPWNNGTAYWDCGGARHTFSPAASDYKNSWNHYVFTKNAETGDAKVFINGEEEASWTGDTNLITGITGFRIGSDSSSSEFYDGILDEFRIYNYEISSNEIFAISRPWWHVEAEDYTSHNGTVTDDVDDLGGGEYIGWIGDGDWAEYTVSPATSGLYRIEFRVASSGGDGSIDVISGSDTLGSLYVGDTGGWQSWETKSIYVEFADAGEQTLKLYFDVPTGGFNVNWFSYEPAGAPVSVAVSSTRNQMMRYGLDYERLWFWYGSGLDEVPEWSVNDCNIDFIRCAVNSAYELDQATDPAGVTNYNLSAYTKKIIPMMTAMQEANPNIKWFASPRPLNEAVSSATWQPYPLWVTGASSYTAGDYDFNDIKCAQYLIRYLRLMKHYGFKISYIDLTNEWQSNVSGGKITQSDARDLVEYMKAYIEDPSSYQAEVDPTGFYAENYPELEPGDMPLTIAPSSWNYEQGTYWISNLDTDAKKAAIDIAASHNTDKSGSAQAFADQAIETLGADKEIWETEQHGWKGNSTTSEAMSFSYMIETVRAGFTGLSGWLAIGTTSQGHCYLLNNGTTVTRNVKYYMFKKLSTTSNYGYALDIDETDDLTSTMALIRENLLTIWVINTSSDTVLAEFDISEFSWDGSAVTTTRWDEDLSINGDETPEGIEGVPLETTASKVKVALAGRAAYCIEIPLVDTEDNFPFVQAESYGSGSGVSIESCSDTGGGEMVAFSAAGSAVVFNLDVTKTYTNDVAFRVSSESGNIAFNVYDGTNLVASVDRVATGGAQKWTTVYTSFPVDGGPMDLTIEAVSGGWNLNWIEFNQQYYTSGSSDSGLVNLALGLSTNKYSTSNVHSSGYEADKAFDGDRSSNDSRWASAESPAWLQVDFGAATTLNAFAIYEYGNRTTSFEIQYSDDGTTWNTAYEGGNPEDGTVYYFEAVTAQMFRYQSVTSSGNPSIYELEFYYNEVLSDPSVASISVDGGSVTLSWSGDESATYSLQKSTNLVDGFTTIESSIPVHDTTNMNTVATPDDAAFYRIILED